MKIYIAAPFGMASEVEWKAKQVGAAGHECVGLWFLDQPLPGNGTDPATGAECARRARADLRAIGECNWFVLLHGASATGGKHVETGYAAALGKRVSVVGAPENVFGWLWERFADWREFMAELGAETAERPACEWPPEAAAAEEGDAS